MVIQELKPSNRVQGRWLAVLEDGTILRLGEHQVIDFALYTGKELTAEQTDQLGHATQQGARKEKALSLLARKPQSRKELGHKLVQWGAGEDECHAICNRMEELGYLNDVGYAAQIVRHYSAKGFGEKKLQDELYRRGVPRALWPQALEQATDTAQIIDKFIAKKLGGAAPDRAQLQKVSQALARRGYRWGEISQALGRYGTALEEEF